jgi:hypothetical protein
MHMLMVFRLGKQIPQIGYMSKLALLLVILKSELSTKKTQMFHTG